MSRLRSIRTKWIAVAMATTCMSLLLTGACIGVFEYVSYRRALSERLEAIDSVLGVYCSAALAFNDEAAAAEVLSALKSLPEFRSACLYDARGRAFSGILSGDSPCPKTPPPRGTRFENGRLVHTAPLLFESARVGTLRVVVTQDEVWRRLGTSTAVVGIVLTFSALVGWLLSARLSGVVTRPVFSLAATAQRIASQEDYALRAPQASDDEIGVAVVAFNRMLDRIQEVDQALREANRRSIEQARFLASVLDSMGEGMGVVDRQARVLVWNIAATRIVGPCPEGIGVAEWPRYFGLRRGENGPLLDSDDVPAARALRGEATNELELYLAQTESRPVRWIVASAQPLLDSNGSANGAISVFRDTTTQKRVELELRASEESLRQALKMEAVGQLAGGIAHDFNNILTVICGYCDAILADAENGLPYRNELEEIFDAGRRASNLTRQLLAFSRKLPVAPRLVDLNAVVFGAQKMLGRLIGEDIEMVVILGEKLGHVRADPGQLDQLLVNLAVNARDAMPSGGRITIETSRVERDDCYVGEPVGVSPCAYVQLVVSDNGVGMSPDVLKRVFEPFFTTKPQGKGTGLGLATVYGIVRQNGGHIEAKSTLGAGTSFSITLPCVDDREDPEEEVQDNYPRTVRGSESILVVEDERPVREFLCGILRSLGYDVLAAADGVDALKLVADRGRVIHLLVSDVVMPRMSGPELTRTLMLERPGLKVLYISGYTGNMNVVDPTGEVPSFVQKPFTVHTIATAVRRVLDGTR